jgi:hypothetical protein
VSVATRDADRGALRGDVPPPQEQARTTLPDWLRPAWAYALLAAWLLGPAWLHPTTRLVGGARSDAGNTVWNLWFVASALARGELPLHTTLLNHPTGGVLLVADPLNTLFAVPLTRAVGPVATWNLLAGLHVVAGGLAAHALGRRLGGRGWLAGIGYASAPVVLSHLQNGSSEAVSTAWLALAWLALTDALERGGRGRCVRAGVALAVCALGGWYAGVGAFAGAVAAGVLGWRGVEARAAARRAGAAVLVGLTLVAPLAAGTRAVARDEHGLVQIKSTEDLARVRRTVGAADPRAFVLPGDFRAPDFARLPANPSDRVHTTYLGWALGALAAVGLWRHRSDRRAWVLAAIGGTCAVLALGPVLVLDGAPVALRGRALPLPYALLERLPGFDALSLLYRLSTATALAAALLADMGRGTGRARGVVLAGAAVLAEVFLASPARHLPEIAELPDDAALRALATAPDGAVLNLPVRPGANYLREQTVHGKPICGALNSGMNVPGLKLLGGLRSLRVGKGSAATIAEQARADGIRYVVLHDDALMDDVFVGAALTVREAFPALARDGSVSIYRLW